MTLVCIVGASLSGFRTAEALRAKGFDGDIQLVGAEIHLPYDRPPLSKAMLLSSVEEPPRWLTTLEELAALDVWVRLGVVAQGLWRRGGGWHVDLGADGVVDADVVVVATGATARQPLASDLAGVHTLRTLDDQMALRAALLEAVDLVVVGGGFIGCEVATAARAHGVSVTVVEALSEPLARVLGSEVGATCAALLRDNGVSVLCGQGVMDLVGEGSVTGVRLTGGDVLPADLVVVGVGARPATDWLTNSGLNVGDGVVCDQFGAAVGTTGVFALGDVARWWHPVIGGAVRVEHWSHVGEQARTVAANIIAPRSQALTAVPYVWSDQFGQKLQIVGWPSPDCDLHWLQQPGESSRVAALYVRQDIVIGGFAIGNPQFIARARRLIASKSALGSALTELSGSVPARAS